MQGTIFNIINYNGKECKKEYTHTHTRVLNFFSCVQLFVTPWTIASQAPLPMGFSRQEYWSGFGCLPAGGLPNPGTEPMSLTDLQWQILYHCAAIARSLSNTLVKVILNLKEFSLSTFPWRSFLTVAQAAILEKWVSSEFSQFALLCLKSYMR